MVNTCQLQVPVVDGDFISQSATTQLQNGEYIKVPILIGCNFDEGASFASESVNTDAEFTAYMESVRFGVANSSVLDTLSVLYPDIPAIGIPAILHGRPAAAPGGLGLQFKRASSIIGDALMHAPRKFMTEIWAANNLTSYSYRFNVVPNGVSYSFGADHFKEVAFVMNNVKGDGYVQKGGVDPFADKLESFKGLVKLITRM